MADRAGWRCLPSGSWRSGTPVYIGDGQSNGPPPWASSPSCSATVSRSQRAECAINDPKPRLHRISDTPHPREPGADWTNKNGRSYFGYKLHIGIDEGSGIVRQARFTPARTADSAVADALVSGDERAVYADRGYDMKARRLWLRAAGIHDRLMHRANKHHPKLPFWKQRRNQLIARRRAPVEAVFSAMKRLYGKARARCHSLERNAADFFAFLTIFNLRRVTLKQA